MRKDCSCYIAVRRAQRIIRKPGHVHNESIIRAGGRAICERPVRDSKLRDSLQIRISSNDLFACDGSLSVLRGVFVTVYRATRDGPSSEEYEYFGKTGVVALGAFTRRCLSLS